ncbi:MAG: S26 family signal peptidase [Bacteroidales bacterium]|nr:S26 family signal peptidase [Bacteroidales bacterium]
MSPSHARIAKGVIFGTIIAAAIIWARAYFLLIPLAIGTLAYVRTDFFGRVVRWVERHTPLTRSIITSVICLLVAGLTVWFVTQYLVVFAHCTVPGVGNKLCLVLKFRYGVAVDAQDPEAYHRTHRLGPIAHGDMALVQMPCGKMVSRVVAVPGDTVLMVGARVKVNGHVVYDAKATASFLLNKRVPYSVKRTLSSEMKRGTVRSCVYDDANGKRPKLVEDTATVRLPLVHLNNFAPYLHSAILANIPDPRCFPWQANYNWNAYDWGPMVMPKAGETLAVAAADRAYYGVLHNTFEPTSGQWPIRSAEVAHKQDCSFVLDYYFVVNDDRDVINDSRLYGPVPECNIISNVVIL